jgi:hypothetical protein
MTDDIQTLYQQAIQFAAERHGDRKIPGSGIPYAVRLREVFFCRKLYAVRAATALQIKSFLLSHTFRYGCIAIPFVKLSEALGS